MALIVYGVMFMCWAKNALNGPKNARVFKISEEIKIINNDIPITKLSQFFILPGNIFSCFLVSNFITN